jgi:hypothetical protein
MRALDFDPARPVRVRLLSPLGYQPQHSVVVSGARLVTRDDLAVSAVDGEPSLAHGVDLDHYSELEFLHLEEIRFFAAIALAVHPDEGSVHVYPLHDDLQVERGLDDGTLRDRALQHANTIQGGRGWVIRCFLPPLADRPTIGGTRA